MELGVIETVVNTKRSTLLGVLKIILIVLAVCFLFLGIIASFIFLIPAAACGAGAYFADLNSDVDYEYSLVDKELRIAKILKKQRRKHMGSYDLSTMEIMGPYNAYQLDSYKKNTSYKVTDYSDQDKNDNSNKVLIFLDNKTELVLTIDSEEGRRLTDCIRQFSGYKAIR